MTSDDAFAEFLQSIPREKSPEQVDHIEHEHDVERGPYVSHQVVHHEYGESRG